MSPKFTESEVEAAALAWLEGLGYAIKHGPEIAVGEPGAEPVDLNLRGGLEGRPGRTVQEEAVIES